MRSHAHPELVVQRRSFLGLCAATILGPRSGPGPGRADPDLSLEEFLEDVLPVARRLRRQLEARPRRTLEDQYLHTLASHAVLLGDVPPPEQRPSSQGEGVEIGASWVGDPFVVLHWTLAPGARVRLHAHTYGNVCTLALEGSALVRNFEADVPPGEDRQTRLLRTTDQALRPGDTNLVPLSHGWCHGFVAGPSGARGLDITTRLGERAPTPYFVGREDPLTSPAREFEGRWVLE